jgi:hypothetical protein
VGWNLNRDVALGGKRFLAAARVRVPSFTGIKFVRCHLASPQLSDGYACGKYLPGANMNGICIQ